MGRVLRFMVLCGALVLLSDVALAGQSASLDCVQWGGGDNPECVTYELKVTITSDSDVGRPGAFGIGAQISDGKMGFWTVANGWQSMMGGLVPPVDGYYQALPASRSYLVYRGPYSGLCSLSGLQPFDLYAAHGALSPANEHTVSQIISSGSNLPADHIRSMFIQMDVFKGAANGAVKGGLVYSLRNCGGA